MGDMGDVVQKLLESWGAEATGAGAGEDEAAGGADELGDAMGAAGSG